MGYVAVRTLNLIRQNSRNFCIEKVHVKKFDLIGPADPVSNLRPIIRTRSPNEMGMQKKLTDYQDFVQNWNQEFWTKHNSNFIQKRKVFAERRDLLNNPNSDEMSEFYKKFLDDNWRTHLSYNYQWYKHNLKLLFLSYATLFEKMFRYSGKPLENKAAKLRPLSINTEARKFESNQFLHGENTAYKRPTVNFVTNMSGYDPTDDMIVCPYDPVHKVKRNHMFKHITKCSKRHPDIILETCPFNSLHRFKKEDEEMHLMDCPNRGNFESYIKSCDVEKIPIQPVIDKSDSTENWDNDCDCPSYDPKKKLENSLIPRTLRNATKSEKRKFREDERERFAKLRRVIDEGGVDDYAYKKEMIEFENGAGTSESSVDIVHPVLIVPETPPTPIITKQELPDPAPEPIPVPVLKQEPEQSTENNDNTK